MTLFTWNKKIWQGLRKRFSKNNQRHILIHNHIFKNAGTTIDWALRRNFGENFIDHRDDQNMQKGPDYLGPFLLDHPNIRALSTHHLRLPLPLLDNVIFLTIMMFRHPIERVTSVYNFECKQAQAETLGARFARNHDLRQYVLWRMRDDVPPTIRNFHIFRSLPGAVDWQREAGAIEILKAKHYINTLQLIGFVEYFNESMILFEETLNAVCPSIDFSYKKQNVGQQNNDSQELRIEKLRKEIGDAAFALLLDRNRADMELYNHAKRIFDNRLSQIPNLDAKIDNFGNRCQCRL